MGLADEQIVAALHAAGVSLEDARDFSLSGCHEVIVTATDFGQAPSAPSS